MASEDDLVLKAGASTTDVFAVHGRNSSARDSLFQFLRALGLRPIEWNHAVELSGKTSPYIGEILESAFAASQAIVVLLTGDDLAKMDDVFTESDDPLYEKELTPQARPSCAAQVGTQTNWREIGDWSLA